jgi:multidrug resistance efflux pump
MACVAAIVVVVVVVVVVVIVVVVLIVIIIVGVVSVSTRAAYVHARVSHLYLERIVHCDASRCR